MHAVAAFSMTISRWYVDMYTDATMVRTTASLREGKHSLAAAAVAGVFLFAGGTPGSALWLGMKRWSEGCSC